MNRIRTKASALLLAVMLAVGAIGITGIDLSDDLPLADEAAEAHRNTCLSHRSCGWRDISFFNTHRFWGPVFHEYNVFRAHFFAQQLLFSHKDWVFDSNR